MSDFFTGEAKFELGQFDESLPYLERAIDSFKRGDEPSIRSEAAQMVAEIFMMDDKLEPTRLIFARSLRYVGPTCETIKSHRLLAQYCPRSDALIVRDRGRKAEINGDSKLAKRSAWTQRIQDHISIELG